MKNLKQTIKASRERAYKAAQQTRTVGNFASNPIAFVARLTRQKFFDWLEGNEEPRQSEEENAQAQNAQETETSTGEKHTAATIARAIAQPTSDDAIVILSVHDRREYELGQKVNYSGDITFYLGRYREQRQPNQAILVLLQPCASDRFETSERTLAEAIQSNAWQAGLEYAIKCRLLLPFDIAKPRDRDETFYLVYEASHFDLQWQNPTLSSLQNERATTTPLEVYYFLEDVLQTLDQLHTDNRLLGERGRYAHIAHGNLKLETMVRDRDRKICVGGLALWERETKSHHGMAIVVAKNKEHLRREREKAKDLEILGKLGQILISSDYDLTEHPLKNFLDRLMNRSYGTAREATRALKQIPQKSLTEITRNTAHRNGKAAATELAETRSGVSPSLLWLLGIVLVGGIGTWWLGQRPKPAIPNPLTEELVSPNTCFLESKEHCRIADKLANVSQLSYGYTEAWKDLSLPSGIRLDREIQSRYPSLTLNATLITNPSDRQTVRLDAVPINPSSDNSDGDIDVTIGYDGLVLFVSAQPGKRALLEALEGKISLDTIKQLYASDAKNWQDLNIPVDLPIQRLQLDNQAVRSLFQQLMSAQEQEIDMQVPVTKNSLSGIIEAVAQTPGAIGIARLSDVFTQCSVYPLAIATNKGTFQPFVEVNRREINLKTDLCDDKGSYFPDRKLFMSQDYPLQYRLVVKDGLVEGNTLGRDFAELLLTDEAQTLLRAAGVVPQRWHGDRKMSDEIVPQE